MSLTSTSARAVRIVGLTVVTIGAILALGMLMYERYLAERPLPPRGDDVPTAVVSPSASRVVIVIIDSLREDAAADATVMPAFARVAAAGASGVNLTTEMTLTTMSVVTMATGMTPPISWSLKNFGIETFEDESAFSIVGAHHGIALLGDASWTQLFGAHALKTLSFEDKGFYQYAPGGITTDDRETLDTAEQALADPAHKLVVIHVTSSDKAAHQSGALVRKDDGSLSDYGTSLQTIDAAIGRLYDAHPDATWMLMSDHGCSLRGNHGGGEPEARRAPFAWAGPGILPARDIVQPMNNVAATVTALFGLRAPRTAETPAAFDVMTLTPEQVGALTNAHTATRRGYVQRYADEAGVDVTLPADADLARLETAVTEIDTMGRGWLRPAGLALGLLAMFALIFGAGRSSAAARPAVWASSWCALSFLMIFFDGWQFPSIQLLGEIAISPRGFLSRAGIIAAIAAVAVVVARRVPDPRGVVWVAWAVVVLMVGQSVMRWPYGPLSEMYRTMLIVGVLGALLVAQDRRRVAWVLAALVGAYAAFTYGVGDVLDHRSADSHPLGAANVAYALALIGLAAEARRRDRSRHAAIVWAALGVLGVLAGVYQAVGSVWMIKLLLVGLLAPPAAVALRGDPKMARNVVIAVGLIAYRALAVDARMLVMLGVALVAWLASDVRTRNTSLTTPVMAGFALLLHQSYFYEAGYAFSFSALDMTVAFAATRDAIDLGQGFLFLMVQGLGPWLVLVACAVYNRAANGDPAGVQTMMLALIGAFAIEAWGAFASFEYQISNHWFTMHAVPLILFSACNALLVGVALLASLGAARPVTPS